MRHICAFILGLSIALPAAASDYITQYVGYFDVTQDDDAAAQFGAQYRGPDVYYGTRPTVGMDVNNDGAIYGYGGFYIDVPLSDSIIFTPNIVAGLYHDGDGKDLGHAVEFRSGLELSYQFESAHRLGLAFNHISNASLGRRNPGAETLQLVFQMPLGALE